MYEYLDSDTRGLISDKYKNSGLMTMASGFAQAVSGYIDYNALKIEAMGYGTSAMSVELQAEQQANLLRKQYIEAVGNVTYGAAARGVKTTSGNVRANIERSAEEVNKDIQTNRENAQMAAREYRLQARIAKRNAKSSLVSGLASGIASGISGYQDYQLGKSIGGEDMGQTKTGKINVPTRKPKRG